MKRFLLLAVVCVSFAGCGGVKEVKEKVTPPAATSVKTLVDSIAESGQPVGSGGMEIQTAIDGIKASDPTKGAELEKLFKQLQAATSASDIKAKAKALSAKL